MKLEKKNLIVERPYNQFIRQRKVLLKYLQQIIRSQRYLMKH